MYNLVRRNIFFTYLLILFPAALITGPFIPEIISFLFFIVFFKFFKVHNKNFFKNKIILFLIIFYFYLLIISFFKIEILEILSDQFYYFRFIIFSLVIYYLIKENKNILNYLGYCFLIIFVLLISDVSIQFFFGKNSLGMENITTNRHSGVFGDELILGSYLSRFFPLLIGLIYINEHFKFKTILISFICSLAVWGVFITGERTAFGLIFVSLFFIFLKKDLRKILAINVFFILFFLVVLSYFNKSQRYRMFIEPIQQMTLLTDKFLNKYKDVAEQYPKIENKKFYIFSSHHQSHYKTAIEMFKDNILFGVGPEQFRVKCKLEKYAIESDPCSTHPHNYLIQVLSETGIIGLFFYLTVLTFVLFKIIRTTNLDQYKNVKDINYFIYLSILINLWPFFPSGNLFNNWLSFILYFPLGIYLYTIDYKNDRI